jgi:glycosyltransferase involved in cell wall biosynthesis
VASCFHATAESEHADIRRLGFKQPIMIIPNGIDIPNALEKVKREQRTLLFLGRIHPKKGLDILLKAWEAVHKNFPEWKLKIVGNDDGYYGSNGYLDKLKKMARMLFLDRIEFCGSAYGQEKKLTYHNADLFVLPTYSENFGMTVAEALACGTPTIVSMGAPWEGLSSNKAGWWIEIGVDPLIVCLQNALSRSYNELLEMGMNGRRWMECEFSWHNIGSQITETYRWLSDRSLPKPPWVRLD